VADFPVPPAAQVAAESPAPEKARPEEVPAQAPPAAAPVASQPAPFQGIPSFSAGELDIRPRYPFGARMRGEQGCVRLLVKVLASGRADHVSVAETSGFSALDGAAIDAVKKARFHGVMPSSAGPGGELLLRFRFQLVDAPPAGPSSGETAR
jgi:periplasmic protein TonB